MKHLRVGFIAVMLGAGSAVASPAGDIAGTWECRLPGVQYKNKPPILFVADAGADQISIEVDGFSREIFGRSEVLADADGWFKVKPAQGQQFMIRPEGMAAKQKTASMNLRFADAKGDYRCLRLPPSGMPASAPAAAPAAEAPPPPADTGATPPPADSGAAPAPQSMQPEGAAKPNQ
jgi:hypothetical protein